MDTTANFAGERILVTGACGTIGSEIINQLLAHHSPKEILAVDNNETSLFMIEEQYKKYEQVKFLLADITQWNRMYRSNMEGIDTVFHTAAFKHVVLCERSPALAVSNNIVGLQNMIQSATEARVKRFTFTSSDKAVNPTNVMGTSKLMGERLVSAAHAVQRKHVTIFASTRFGNVLGSRGSVIPIFKAQIKSGGPVTLTDTAMTRFVMSVSDAARLVLSSALMACGGEVFVTKMPVIRIQDLAEVMIEKLAPFYGKSPGSVIVKIIGKKTGEKIYEELMTEEETGRAVECRDFFAILPAFRALYGNITYKYAEQTRAPVHQPYNSATQKPLDRNDLTALLIDTGVFSASLPPRQA
ncbi:polysaccharide biosynthesis protein [Desulfovibrio sp. OttesenSCG-928-M16]|nr:polysaccharide biosynthesis protein [Desulfovibrio sp. OttesenSCG-928-M16]